MSIDMAGKIKQGQDYIINYYRKYLEREYFPAQWSFVCGAGDNLKRTKGFHDAPTAQQT